MLHQTAAGAAVGKEGCREEFPEGQKVLETPWRGLLPSPSCRDSSQPGRRSQSQEWVTKASPQTSRYAASPTSVSGKLERIAALHTGGQQGQGRRGRGGKGVKQSLVSFNQASKTTLRASATPFTPTQSIPAEGPANVKQQQETPPVGGTSERRHCKDDRSKVDESLNTQVEDRMERSGAERKPHMEEHQRRRESTTEVVAPLSEREGDGSRGASGSTLTEGFFASTVEPEPTISGSEKEANEQEQRDEVMVLESIFAGDFHETGSEPRSCELSVHVALPASTVQVLGRLPLDFAADPSLERSEGDLVEHAPPEEETIDEAGGGSEARGQDETVSSGGQIRVIESPGGARRLSLMLQHLPPLRLTCTLPASYPSHSPPRFALSSVWLTKAQLGQLCQGLDKVWEDNRGQVVLYSWADWLNRETFEILGLGERFEIGGSKKGKESQGEDERAFAEGWGVQDVLPRLLRYNEERIMEDFRSGVHECQICFSEQPGVDFVHLWPGCRHNFCRGCMKAMADIHVKEGSLAALACPQTDCKKPLAPNVIKDLLEPEQFQRWETLTLQRTFDSMSDVVYCPRCETPTIEEADHTAQCQKCFFAFCSLCDQSTHFGSQCMDAEAKLAILKERTRGRAPGEEQKRKEAALIAEILSMKYVEKEARQCPTCSMAIQKSEGCNKMTCWNCHAYFCYRCGKAISGYDHFGSGACVLFEQDAIDAWNRMMHYQPERDEANVRLQVQIDMHPNRVRHCPACRQPNLKEAGNNHLRCWSCQNHFCGACGKHVLKGSHHFGPKGCKQHTSD